MSRAATTPPAADPGAPPGEVSLRGSIAFLAAFAAALYARQLLLGETFVLRDHVVYTWTERAILAGALRAGRIPEWNDLVGLGTQFAASSANGVTYPPLWLVALFPLPFSMDLVAAMHVLLAGIGAAFLARRLGAGPLGAALAGAALMGSGYVASIAPNKVFAGTAWIPWIAWAADRLAAPAPGRTASLRATAGLAALLAAQQLAGDPASSITGGLVALAVVLARAAPRRLPALGRLALAGLASLPLAAASLLPGLALLPHTTRAALSAGEGAAWSLHPLRLLELLWPRALGDPTDPARSLVPVLADAGGGALEPSWTFSAFLGVPVLGLAGLAVLRGRPGARGLALGAAGLTVLALGAFTPLYPLWRAVFPLERLVRYPEKHLAGAVVLLCALAGAGLASLGERRDRRATLALGLAGASLALPLATAALLRSGVEAWLRPQARLLPSLDPAAALDVSLRAGGAAAAAATIAFGLLLASLRWRPAGALGVGAVALHLLLEGWAVTPVAPASRLSEPPRLLARLAPRGTLGPPPRIFRSPLLDADLPPGAQAEVRHETLFLDSPGRFGVAALPGFEGWRSREAAAFWARAGAMPLAALQTLYSVDAFVLPSDLRRRLFREGSGRGAGVVAEVLFEPGSDGGAWSLVRSEGIRPRAFVAPRWRWSSFEEALAATVEPSRAADPGLVLLTGSGDPSPPGSGPLAPGPCEIASYRPERVELSCSSPAGGFAVLVEENAPGWAATVDGAPARIETADVLLRAVRVGAGAHRVVFEYRTPLLRAGVVVSALAWLGWLAWLRATRRLAGG